MPKHLGKGKLSIVICDDDAWMLERLQGVIMQVLSREYDITILCETSPQNLLTNIGMVQIAVLDIQLLESNGIDLARTILVQNPECRIIFVSGFLCYVSDVYDVPHVCLVLKDQLQEQLPRFLLRAAAEVMSQAGQTLTVRIKGAAQTLCLSDICFLERKEHVTMLYMKSGEQLQTREKLGDLLSRVSNWRLCRCHISFAVNLKWVESIRGRDFILHDGTCVPISRVNMQAAKNSFFRYLRETT